MINNKGITMISLVITVILLIILSSVITYTGLSSITNNKFEKLKYEMQIVQANVNLWYEETKDMTMDEIRTNGYGSPLPDEKKSNIQNAVNAVRNKGYSNVSTNLDNYRYFEKSAFTARGVEGVENTYVIDIKNQVAILVEPYEYNGQNYYIIDQVKDIVR